MTTTKTAFLYHKFLKSSANKVFDAQSPYLSTNPPEFYPGIVIYSEHSEILTNHL